MQLEDYKKNVNTIRSVHENLRRNVHLGKDPNKIWNDHLKEEELRKNYSKAMFNLATKIWSKNESRIYWCYDICMEYFFRGGLQKSLRREARIKCRSAINFKSHDESSCVGNMNRKLMLLDVGSCYNPFSKFDEFICVPIDLTPATLDVLQCDFLNVTVYPQAHFKENFHHHLNKIHLCENEFDIIVFSLVLEYLPTPKQRWMFCCKAWQLLVENGLLIIITPDSKSQLHNAPMMKSWRLGIETIGFIRIKYEKLPHFHCMAYRKLSVSCTKKFLHDGSLTNSIYIPQDFNVYKANHMPVDRSEEEDKVVLKFFSELSPETELF